MKWEGKQMDRSIPSIAMAVLTVLILGGCTTSLSDRFSPEIEKVKYVANMSVCHGTDVIRFTATGIGNVIEQSVGGFVYLAANSGGAVSNPVGLLAIGVAGGVYGTGAGVVKTFDEWESGVDDCLRNVSYGSPRDGHMDVPTSA